MAMIRSLRQWAMDERVNSFDDFYIGQMQWTSIFMINLGAHLASLSFDSLSSPRIDAHLRFHEHENQAERGGCAIVALQRLIELIMRESQSQTTAIRVKCELAASITSRGQRYPRLWH
jgi:hypothetical protein